MSFDNDRRIFPGLHDAASKSAPEIHERAAEWDDHPFEPEWGRGASGTARRVVVSKSRGASTGSLWLALMFLLVALAGISILGYRTLLDANIRLSQVPAMLRSISTMDGRVGNLETQLHAWTEKFQGLPDRVAKLEKRVTADYLHARRHAEVLTAQLQKQIQDEMNKRDAVVDSRLDELTTAQKDAEQREARFQQQLSDAQRQIASLRQETNGDLALLHEHVAGNEEQMNSLAQQMKRQRVDFELTRNQITDLSPEITMDLTATNTQYQRFSGWVYFEPDRRYLWVRDQGVSQPVIFYGREKGRQYQLILTGIRENSATGYLLLPATGSVLSSEVIEGATAGQ